MFKRTFLFAACLPLLSVCLHAQTAAAPPKRIAIVKADDVRSVSGKWDKFIGLAKERDVKVSLGVITNSLEKKDEAYAAWLKKWADSGQVEFWNHGWDHKSWTDAAGKKMSEFGGSGYEHQKEHLTKSQAAITPVLGKPFPAFGSPFNAMDPDTVKALNEIPEITLVFSYPGMKILTPLKGKVLLPMNLRGEVDTGKPDFAKFKEAYTAKNTPDLTFAAIQFHPMGFSEEGFKHFTDIIDFLKAEGWTFVLPSEYLKMVKP